MKCFTLKKILVIERYKKLKLLLQCNSRIDQLYVFKTLDKKIDM